MGAMFAALDGIFALSDILEEFHVQFRREIFAATVFEVCSTKDIMQLSKTKMANVPIFDLIPPHQDDAEYFKELFYNAGRTDFGKMGYFFIRMNTFKGARQAMYGQRG